jgi:hypothetical protein
MRVFLQSLVDCHFELARGALVQTSGQAMLGLRAGGEPRDCARLHQLKPSAELLAVVRHEPGWLDGSVRQQMDGVDPPDLFSHLDA